MNLNNLEKTNKENSKLMSIINPNDRQLLNRSEIDEINKLIDISNYNSFEFDDLCKMLDWVWDNLGCDNQNFNWEKIQKFYNHPVWLLNGFFAETNEFSIQNRNSIANWIVRHKTKIRLVLDYGGGFGTLARLVAEKECDLVVDVYEPYPHRLAILKSQAYHNLHFVNSLTQKYDCLISTDVLEHIEDPLLIFARMIDRVNLQGYLIIHNHFQPTIKCHLPVTFHFIYTFEYFAKLMGLSLVETCEGGCAIVYQKIEEKPFNWNIIRSFEKISQILYPILKLGFQLKRALSTKNFN